MLSETCGSSRQGDTSSTKYQVELGDGVRAIYQNLTVTDEPIQHRYENPGVYKVTVRAENMAGHDKATMFIQVTGESGPVVLSCLVQVLEVSDSCRGNI